MTSQISSRVQQIVIVAVLSLFVAPVGVFAQAPMSNGGVLAQAAVREGARLAATLPTAPHQQPPEPRRRWVNRHPVLAGALIGAGVGFGWYAVTFNGLGGGLYGLPAGALVGAGTGYVVSR